MGLSIKALAEGRELVREVPVKALGGETIMIRELPASALDKLHEDYSNEGGLSNDGVAKLLQATLTDEGRASFTDEEVQEFIRNNQSSVVREITQLIVNVHTGTESGEF